MSQGFRPRGPPGPRRFRKNQGLTRPIYRKSVGRPSLRGRRLVSYFPHSRTMTRPGDSVIYKGIGIPDRFYTTMKYTEQIQLTAGAGTEYQVYQFRGNSLYDPNLTGTGSQPTWFDQICSATSLYTQYLVVGSKISLRLNAIGDTFAIGNADVCVTPSQTAYVSTAWTDIDDQLSYRASKASTTVRYDNNGPTYLSHKAQTSSVLDIKDVDDNLAICAANYNSNPSAPWYWIIGAQGMDRTSQTMNLNIMVTLTFYVRFFNTSDRPQS